MQDGRAEPRRAAVALCSGSRVAMNRGLCRGGQWLLSCALVLIFASPLFSQGGDAPTELNASADSGGRILLTWRAPEVNAGAVTGYRIRHTSLTSGLFRVSVGGTPISGGVTRRRFSPGTRGRERYIRFEVRAVRGSALSGWSESVMYDLETSSTVTVPAAPSGLSAEIVAGEGVLTWDDAGQATILRYELKYIRGGELVQNWRNIEGSHAGTTEHTVGGLSAGASYTFWVRAVSVLGAGGGASAAVSLVPDAPANLTARPGDGQVRLKWDDAMDVSVTGYEFRYIREGMPYSVWIGIPVSTSHTIGGLTNGVEHTFEVRALAGEAHGDSSVVRVTPTPPSGAVEGLAGWPGAGRVVLTWTEGGGTGVTGFEVSYGDPNGLILDWTAAAAVDEGAGYSTTLTGLIDGTRYRVGLRAVNVAGPGAPSHVWVTVGALPAPGGLAASAGEGAVTLSWDRADDAGIAGYEVRVTDAGGIAGAWTAIPGMDAAATRHTVGGLENGTLYTFEVRGVNPAGVGAMSSVTAAPGVPAAPERLRWTLAQGAVALTWAVAGNAAITGYQVRWYAGASTDVAWTDIAGSFAGTDRYVVTGVTNVRSYTFEVRAVSAAGPGAAAGVMPMTAKAPGNLRAEAGVNAVTLHWDEPPDASITKYQVRIYEAGAQVPPWSDVEGSDAGTIDHEETGLTNGQSYTFDVRAVNTFGPGAASSVSAAPVPAPPAGLTATAGVGQVTLVWEVTTDASVTGYQLRFFRGGVPVTGWFDVPVTSPHPIVGLPNGIEHTFGVRAVSGTVHGEASVAKATPVPATPANLEATAGVNQVTLAWTAPGDASVTAYQLTYYSGARPAAPSWTDIPGSGPGTADHVVRGLTNGTAYTFEVRAVAAATPGDASAAAATPYPAAPADLEATAGVSQVRLEWTATDDDAVTAYQLMYYSGDRPAQPAWTGIPDSDASTTDHVVTGLTNGTAYTFEVRALAAATPGEASAAAAAPAPAAPDQLGALSQDRAVTLSWADPMDDAVDGYEVRHGEDAASVSAAAWRDIAAGDVERRSHRVSPLTNGTTYTFELRARAGFVRGAASSVTARAGCPSIAVTGVGDTTVTVGQALSMQAVVSGVQDGRYGLAVVPEEGSGLSIDEESGAISGAPTAAGAYTVTVTVTDENGCTGESDFTVQVCPVIAVGGLRDTSVTVGQALSMQAVVSGAQDGRYALAVVPEGSGLSIDEQSGVITGAPTAAGAYTVTVRVTDAGGCMGEGAFMVQVCPVVTVAAIEDVTVTVGDSISIPAVAEGGCGTIAYTMTGAPEDVEIDGTTGVISGAAAPAGRYEVTVTAADEEGNTGQEGFTLTVVCPEITVGGLSDATVTVGQSVSMTATGSGSRASYWYFISSEPAQGITLSIGERDGAVTVTAASAGAYTVTVRVRDDYGCSATGTFTVTVNCPDIAVADVRSFEVEVNRTFRRTAAVSGGCGTRSSSKEAGPEWVRHRIDDNGNLIVHGTAPSTPGRHEVRVRVRDTGDAGNHDDEQFTITVVSPPPPPLGIMCPSDITVTEGGAIRTTASAWEGVPPYSFQRLSVRPSGQTLTLTANKGKATITGTAGPEGAYDVSVRVNDSDGASESCQFRITVTPRSCSAIAVSQSPDPVTVKAGGATTVSVSATGGCGSKSFGDPGGLAWVTRTQGTDNQYDVMPPADAAPGNYTFSVTATDAEGNTGTGTIKVRVTCASIGYAGPGKVTVQAGGSETAAATASGGKPDHTFTKTGGPDWVTINAGGTISVTSAPDASGTHTVNVGIQDANECPGTGSFTVEVVCPAVSVAQSPDPVTVQAGGTATVSVSATGGCGSKSFGDPGGLAWVTKKPGTDNQYTVAPPADTSPGNYSFDVTATDSEGNTGAGAINVTVNCPAIKVTQSPDPVTATAGGTATVGVSATGGCGSKSFGDPVGLAWVTKKQGTDSQYTVAPPADTSPGNFTFSVTATDSEGNTGTGAINVTVNCPAITVTQSPDPVTVKAGGTATVSVSAAGGCGSKSFGDPVGLAWARKTASNQYTVAPPADTSPGNFTFSVTATDAEGNTGAGVINVTVNCPAITVAQSPDPVTVKAGGTATVSVSATGGCGAKTFGNPVGLAWARKTASNVYTVAPSADATPGNYTFNVTATDEQRNTGAGTIKVTVACPTITVGGLSDVTVEVKKDLPSITASASGGRGQYRYRRKSGPGWVEVDAGGGIGGRAPGVRGEFNVTVEATDASGCTGEKSFIIRVIVPPLTIADIDDVDADVNKTISSITPSASGGETPYTFSTSGRPAGISSSTSTGVISGAPTALGTFIITVTVTDARPETAETDFTMYVSRALSIGSISDVVVTWQLDMDPIQVSASGGRGAYTYSLESAPAGITISSGGSIGGTPTQLGSATVTVIVKDQGKRQEEASFTMTVALPGDFNGDGRRDAADAKLFNKMMGLRRSDAGYDRRMDLNGDGTINYADFVILSGYIESDAAARGGGGS